jgi:AraC-like DNA-binding protein
MILFTSTWDGHIDRGDKSKYFFAMAIRAILPDMDTRNALLKYTLPVPKDERLSKIESHIRSHLTEPISIGQLAERFGMSTRTLSRLFMQDLGMSYIQFLRAIRMITAFELLVENKHTIKEIAYKLGYSSVPTFSNVFYQGTGIRPTQYMNLRKTENPNLPSALSS